MVGKTGGQDRRAGPGEHVRHRRSERTGQHPATAEWEAAFVAEYGEAEQADKQPVRVARDRAVGFVCSRAPAGADISSLFRSCCRPGIDDDHTSMFTCS